MNQETLKLGAGILVVLIYVAVKWWRVSTVMKREAAEPRPHFSLSPEWYKEEEKKE